MRPKGERDLGRQGAGRDASGLCGLEGASSKGQCLPGVWPRARERKWRGGRWPNFNLLLGHPEEDGIYSMQ